MHVYTAEEIRAIDNNASKQGFSLFTLMENAGRGIAEAIKHQTNKEAHILILAGRGNNGGDGIVAARYLKETGYHVTLCFPLGDPKTETAQAHLTYYEQQNFTSTPWEENLKADVIVDALLGIGAKPPLRENAATIVNWANEHSANRYAVDLPTGLSADDGLVETVGLEPTKQFTVFRADVTFVLHGAKPSAILHPSSNFYGKTIPIDIGLKQTSTIRRTTEKEVQSSMPKRSKASHKGTFGTTLLIAGSDEMPGSALLAATGAIRSGTGRLVLGTTKFAASIITTAVPEATYMFEGLKQVSEGTLPPKISAIGIGPGLSDKSLIKKALDALMRTDIPLVIDAGALLESRNWKRNAPTIITPHPGEFSILTGLPIAHIEANRITIAQEYSQKNSAIVVLKGQYTVIAFPNGMVRLNPTGNSGLAKGGSGDVLTGMITSMLAYYEDADAAVINAVYLHGLCAAYWSEKNSEVAMTASDFHMLLPKVLKRMERDTI